MNENIKKVAIFSGIGLAGIVLIIIVLALIFGGENRFVCSLVETEDNRQMDSRYSIIFDDNDMPKSVTWTQSITLSGDYNTSENIKEVRISAEEVAEIFSERDGAEASVTVNRNRITLRVEMEVAEMDELDLRMLKLDFNKEDLVVAFEGEGYTCR
jgi:hypothetical protein